METLWSVEQLANVVNEWCDEHGIAPVSGQAGERITERNIRYYRTLGLLDPPLLGGGQGFGERHRLQLVALRLLQAQGLPLIRIRELLFGRTTEELKQIETRGLAEVQATPGIRFRPALHESWAVTPLDDEFLIVSRRGRGVPAETRQRLLAVLRRGQPNNRRPQGTTKEN